MTSKLPRSYWEEAVNMAAFVSHMLPTASCGNVSPYELWTKSPPPMSHLRTFGCLAYIAVRKTHCLWKFGATGKRGIFVGYENNGTTFRVVCLRDMKLLPTRHTRFNFALPPVAVAAPNSASSTPADASSSLGFVTPPSTPPRGALAPAAPLPL
ncbi:hypothetical protein PCASD_08550 [Puccinia coronata f. sp. avenae]|uniref:Retroviral polymerase SH3-like domain-containing protein n=1 Tax=Puccinia coronata f. sp. avenae TaxID=200324 RepID=A0A2N5UR62_9BASI|nr:hypothetical protein PCASD_08550 [Puccinia coronata f. sp. avenae]